MYILGILALASIQVASAGLIHQLLGMLQSYHDQHSAPQEVNVIEYPEDTPTEDIVEILDHLNTQALKNKPANNDKLQKVCNALREASKAKVHPDEEPKIREMTKEFGAIVKDENGKTIIRQMHVGIHDCLLEFELPMGLAPPLYIPALIAEESIRLKRVDKSVYGSEWAETEDDQCLAEQFFVFANEQSTNSASTKGGNYVLVESIIIQNGIVERYIKELKKIIPINHGKKSASPAAA